MIAGYQKKIENNGFFSSSKPKTEKHAIISITVTYVLLSFPRAAFGVASSDMKDELGLDNGDIATLLMIQVMAYGFGKACNGMIIDCMDSRYALWFFMTVSMIACFGLSFVSDSVSMYPYLAVNMYSHSATWPSMAKLIYNWVDEDSYDRGFSFLAISSRVGTFLSLLVLGFVIWVSDWRWALRAASIVIGLGIVFSTVMMIDRAAPPIKEEHKATSKEMGKVGCCGIWSRIRTDARFWLVLVGISTMSVMVGISAVMPLWLTDVFRPCTDTENGNCNSLFESGHAAIVTSLVPLGVICSLIYGLFYIKDVGSIKGATKQATRTVVFLIVATVLVVMFAVWTTLVEAGERPKQDPGNWIGGLAVFFFIFGFLMGYPYYIPPSVYAIKKGEGNAATLTAILDLGGLILVTGFLYFGTSWSEADGVSETALTTWRYPFYLFTIIAVIATVTMSGYLYLNLNVIKRTLRGKIPQQFQLK